MPKPLVFLSHSAKDPVARRVLLTLARRLQAGGFRVLLDRTRLRVGDSWREEINTWIGLCHASVILFSQDALKSDWVLKEATNLTWRHGLDESFLVLPILLPPVSADDLKKSRFSPLAVEEIQATAGQAPEEIAEEVLERLEPLRTALHAGGPLQELERQVAASLRQIESRDPYALQRVAGEVGIELGTFLPDDDEIARFARGLFHAGLDRVKLAVEKLAPYLDEANALGILNRLVPFWVNPVAVASIPGLLQRTEEQRMIGVWGKKRRFTGECYIQRACCRYPSWAIVTPTGVAGEDQSGALIQEIRASLAAALSSTDEDLDDLLQALREEKPLDAAFVILPGDVRPEVLARLRQSFPDVTFFLFWNEPPADLASLIKSGVEVLPEPGAEEERAHKLWTVAKSKIARKNPQLGAGR